MWIMKKQSASLLDAVFWFYDRVFGARLIWRPGTFAESAVFHGKRIRQRQYRLSWVVVRRASDAWRFT